MIYSWIIKLLATNNLTFIKYFLPTHKGKSFIGCSYGYQNPDLNLTILRFYDLTCPKRSGCFKDLSDCSGSYDSDNSK